MQVSDLQLDDLNKQAIDLVVNNFQLKVVRVNKTAVTDIAPSFKSLIRKNPVKVLELTETQIDDQFIEVICSTIHNKQDVEITVLDFSKNCINNKAAIRIAPILKEDASLGRRLTVLDLSHNRIGNIGCESIVQCLQ